MVVMERLRFAPSPTGDLHIGGARAALFNWLYARKTGGKFLLRIEDTDRERSSETALESILNSLRWLGLDWDEEPVFQSRRGDLYRSALERLLTSGHAYRCFCTVEEIEAEREAARSEKLTYHYSGKCRALSPETLAAYDAESRPFTVRFRVLPGATTFDDLVHGPTTFRNDTIGDFIIARADGSPVYLLGVAVDDADMGITLVMRGDDHIPNTPKQTMIMEALEYPLPRFAHLPQVLGADGKKLSKRHGAASVMEYRNLGFFPQAVVNFIAFLGWNPGDDREKMPLDELIASFSIEGINKKSGVFDLAKLEWLNGQYLNDLSSGEILTVAGHWFVEAGLVTESEMTSRRAYLVRVIDLLKERCRLITELPEMGRYFLEPPAAYESKGVKKHFNDPDAVARLEFLADRFEKTDPFTEDSTEAMTRAAGDELGVGVAKLIHATRLAVTGVTYGPGLFELMVLIGREEVVRRMRHAVKLLRSGNLVMKGKKA